MDSSKLIKIRTKHKAMNDEIIKQIPTVINESMLILDSKNSNSRMVMLGELKDKDGNSVIVVIETEEKTEKVLFWMI